MSTLACAKEAWHVEIQGVTGKALNNIKARFDIIEEINKHPLSENNLEEFIQHVSDNVSKALQPFGYFKAIIIIKKNLEKKIILIHIDPGPPIMIANIELIITGAGKNNPNLQKFINHFPLAPNQILLTTRYEKAKDILFQIANNQGYIKAFLEKKEININLKNNTANIILHFNTGDRYYFGKTIFNQNNKNTFAPSFLQRFVTLQQNKPFSSQKLLRFQQDLRNGYYFQQVDAAPDFNKTQDHQIPINIAVTPKKSQRYDAGVGYGTFTGPRLTLGTDFRRVTDTGQHFNTQLKLSSVLSGLAVKYYIPGKNPLTDQYTLGGNLQYFAPKNGTSFSETLSASYVKTLKIWQHTSTLNYLNERYQVAGQPTHRSQVLYPSFTLSRIEADNMISPRRGSLLNFTVQGASEDIFSKINFFQSELKAKSIFSPTKSSRIIIRGDLGYTVVKDLNLLPLTLRYFAGGLGSVRGYPYASLGPGKYLEVVSGEFQHRIIGNWNGAVFYDVGNASNIFNGQFNRGDGVGIIYQSFIGPIQLYVGRALSKPGKPLNIEFSIGPDF